MDTNVDSKARIISAAIQLFSQKGYDATRVNEIAETAGVTKALIYYYFNSKKEILDYLVQSLLDDAASITLDFLHAQLEHMLVKKKIAIKDDKLHFADEQAQKEFMANINSYHERIVDFALDNRQILRILLTEALKNSKHRHQLLQLTKHTPVIDKNLIGKKALQNFSHTEYTALFKLFFFQIPLLGFAAFFDDYKNYCQQCEKELRASFLRALQVITISLIAGSEVQPNEGEC
ncbi:MAG: TetR/AcrR family transcriptional regulator [Firmicutes bacterium]|nr:TetR/AcrR family transcriptional regulator [Bacillota bacterium]